MVLDQFVGRCPQVEIKVADPVHGGEEVMVVGWTISRAEAGRGS